jgi:uncharacterized protein (DUF433 family)
MPATKTSHLGVGMYSIADAARLIGEPKSNVYRWARPSVGLVPRYFDPAERTITFVELMELQFVKMFRDEGVSLQAIRKVSRVAAKTFKSDYPFSVKRFDTDGKTIFATLIDDRNKELLEDLQRGQLVFGSIMRPFFHKLDYAAVDDTVTRFWPRGKSGRVVLDPRRKFGKPIDAESGISTQVIVDALKAGSGQKPAIVARWLGIPLAAVKAAEAFEKSLAA